MIEDTGALSTSSKVRDGSISLLLQFLFGLATFLTFPQSLELSKQIRFGECLMTDWRMVKDREVDYATNIVQYHQYSRRWVPQLRGDHYDEVMNRLRAGDSLVVAIDCFALNAASMFFDGQFLSYVSPALIRGEVLIVIMKGEK